ncbi:cytochrome p450 [Moniliophthora roreri MCA 2997]|uniref:Cytochrome p450 n=1 Tax=Moniliophthora roreri (strain MCA 2997) TaxID=1381753 RepID=V2XXU4_MONRO|nr:cytochrome p450 [Moniliophthora roreri MCA 2997]
MPHVLIQLTLAVSAIWIVNKVVQRRAWNAKLRNIPSVGGDGFVSSYITASRFFGHARELISEGYEKYQGRVFKIPRLTGWDIIVTSPQLIDELRKAPDEYLSFDEAMNEAMQVKHTLTLEVSRHDVHHIAIVREQLTKNLSAKFDDVRAEIVEAFADELPVTNEWTKCSVSDAIFQIVARTSNRLFVGLPLCRKKEWLDLNIQFTFQVVISAQLIKIFPEFIKSFVGRYLTPVPKSIKLARKLLEPIIVERLEKQKAAWPDNDKPNDFLMWLMDDASGPQRSAYNLVMRILATNFAAIHTSSITFTDALYHLAAYPQYVPELREEIESIIKENGWSKASIQRMRKLDSFLKEVGRVAGLGGLVSTRKVMKDFIFSDGTTVPAGATVSLPAAGVHFDSVTYPFPPPISHYTKRVLNRNTTKTRTHSTHGVFQTSAPPQKRKASDTKW